LLLKDGRQVTINPVIKRLGAARLQCSVHLVLRVSWLQITTLFGSKSTRVEKWDD